MNGAAAPAVTVVISTRNRSGQIGLALRSILSNDYSDFEVIVVDQSEDDRTEAAVKPFLHDQRVRYVRSDTKGVSAGRNIGFFRARSELILVTDDDCGLAPNCLRGLIAAFETDSRIGIVFGNVLPGPHDRAAGFIPAYVRKESFLARTINDKHLVEGMSAAMGIRRAVWESLHGFDEMLGVGAPLRSGTESDFTVRALLAGYFVLETPDVKVTHHAFRPWDEHRALVRRYWYGTGAMFAKHLKCGRSSVLLHLLRLAWRWAQGGQSAVAASLGGRRHSFSRLAWFIVGFAAGALTPVNTTLGHFVTKCSRSAAFSP